MGDELNLYNIYGPNGPNGRFYRDLELRVTQATSNLVVLGGDLNTIRLPQEDRRGEGEGTREGPVRATDAVLPFVLRLTGLRDCWRDLHPEGREFTHYLHGLESTTF